MSIFSKKPVVVEVPVNNAELEEAAKKIIALKLEVAELKGIQSAMPDPYYVRDMDYNVLIWPEAIAKLTGYSEYEAKKLKCYDIFKAVVCPPGSECPTQNCIKARQFLKDVAVDVYHKNGDAVHTLVSNSGVYDEEGNPIGAVEIVKDNSVVQKSMKSIGDIIKNIESVSAGMYTAIEKVGVISGTVNENAHQAKGSVENGVQAGQSVYERVKQSNKSAGSVQENIRTINESMKFSIEKISNLKEKSENIIQFVTVIQDMAAKTNLLAINASIEAAHAGESGKGFKVVADGIRELSKNSSESAMSIKATINQINGLIQESTNSLNVTEKDIIAGTENISSLLGFVDEIDKATTTLLEIMGIIEKSTDATVKLDEEQNSSVVELEKAGKNLSDIAQSLTVEFDRVFKAIQHIDMG